MVEQIVRSGTGILFDDKAFARWNIPTSIGKDPLPEGGNSAGNNAELDALDAQDALQPITDPLWKMPLWWILEIFPTSYTYQDAQDVWHTTFM
jgi:hypothetical protein